MPTYRLGDIVIVEFPFTDGLQSKRRPALALSTDSDGDVLLARITSKHLTSPGDVVLQDWAQLGLRLPSIVRFSKLTTLHEWRVKQLIGTLPSNDCEQMIAALHELVDSLPESHPER